MLLLLLSNTSTANGPIQPLWMICENGFVNLQECASGEVTIQHDENGMTAFTPEVNGWI